ncbi:hypothetical protein RSOLAG22IIIB_01702 [Rhizoctonia solani]|uniref:C2H2-type domain-containing protein n=1 Tax=Rhizoctonia solani TaxID=456999 RepID=A0A0K6G8X2_9AGAM|nr:hypothetical protein RSOLAG22IIIB_01702 [Rhizoctonia solani]
MSWDGTRRIGRCVSSDDEDLESPVAAGVGVGGALLGGGGIGRVARHADSFVRSTRHRTDTDEPIDPSDDDQGSPRSRRLTFEFRNFNLFPDVNDGHPSPALLEKRRPSSLDIHRVDEEPEYAGYLTSPGYSTVGPSANYFPYGFTHLTQSPPLLPPPPIQTRPTDLSLPLISTLPTLAHSHPHPYRSIHSTRPGPTANPRRNSDVGPSPSTAHREKRVVTLREAVPVPIRTAVAPSTHDDDGSSELSEPEDADGPSKSGDSSQNSSRARRKPTHRTRKKKPYKSRRCDICNKTFTKECDVTRHRRTAHGEDEIEFKCHECGRLFNRKDALERHYKVYEGTPHVARRYQPKTYLGGKKL